jgi:LuxR family maltose regulon positive regulatory protein
MHVTETTKAATPPNRPAFFLATKVFPPRLPAGLIDRPRLAAQTEAKRLTVIKAPAGFGKTSLALTWLDGLGTGSARVAWLSLDAEDDEPARYFNHLAHALRQACGNVGASVIGLTAEASFVPPNSLASTLINELIDVDEEVYLFIDDYHLISEAPIHEAMSLFITNVPSQVHVVLCTRTDPPFPTAKLRARNDLLEIDASTLRFDFDETRRFVEHECPGKLRTTDVKSLFATTEGWAAALRISTSALARDDRPRGWQASAPTGTSRPLADYLEDILQSLPAEMLEFMLRTALLDRLSAPLCEALTGLKRSQVMLDAIVARQLLLEPLDLEGHWFRYHRLMAEYLQRRLKARYPEEITELHRRAWQWYAAERQWTDAVRHAIAAGATDDAIRLMEHCAKSLLKAGDLLTLVGWQRQFPADLMRAQITVTLAIAWGTVLALRFDDALPMLDSIERDAASRGGRRRPRPVGVRRHSLCAGSLAGRSAQGAHARARLSGPAVARCLDHQCGLERGALRPLESGQSRGPSRHPLDSRLDRGRPAQRLLLGLSALPARSRRNAATALPARGAPLQRSDGARRAPFGPALDRGGVMRPDDRPIAL